jgi:hypothetical protein
MDREESMIRDLGAHLAATFGYAIGGADALRFYLMHKTALAARDVLSMRPGELLDAYDAIEKAAQGSRSVH